MKRAMFLLVILGAGAVLPALARSDIATIDAAVRAFVAREVILAAHVTVLRGDEVLLQRGYGAASASGAVPVATAMFPIGSISKQFTAAAIMALVDEGKVRLDARVGDYLPEWFAREPELRVSHLLSQTSGLADFLWLEGYRALADDAATPIAAYVALAAAVPRRFAPGTRWAYSNTNYKALALIAERVTGERFDRVLAVRVLEPNGVADIVPCHGLRADQFVAGVAADGKPAPLDASAAAYTGDGGLCANAAALTTWIRRVLADPTSVVNRLARPAALADGTLVPYGYGLSTRAFLDRRMVWHGGNVDGHSAMIAFVPDEDLGLVILTARGFVWLTELLPVLIGADAPKQAAATEPPPSGRFEDGLFRFDVTADGDAMQVSIDLIGTLRFVPAGPREYVAEKYPATFRFRLPADGSRDRFEFDWGEVRSYARRVQP